MILQALAKYYERIPDVAHEGFQHNEIPFVITLKKNGEYAGLQDTREGEEKKGRVFMVPKAVKRSSGIAANLLWDNPAYVLGRPKPDKKKDINALTERAGKQKESFLNRIKDILCDNLDDAGIAAVIRFLESENYEKIFSHPLWPEIEGKGLNLSFQLEGDTELICQRKVVISAVTDLETNSPTGTQTCLVTGNQDMPVRLHTAIKGVWGARSPGANIVSFNLDAFKSFGKEQGYNAPIGKKAEFAYTTVLNTLLAKDSRQRIQAGNASTIFWAERKHKIEEWFADIFGQPSKEDSEQDNKVIKALFKSPETGVKPVLDDRTKFYVLGLSPNASRIAIRFWYAGTVGEVKQNMKQHFKDISIEHGQNQPEYLSLFRLLISTAVQGRSDKIQPGLAGDFMRAILAGTPYPGTILSSVIRRIKAEQEITYPRASLIKAVLVRKTRFYNTTKKKEEIGMSLDTTNGNAGYRLGRLFAVLEKIQEEANPGINATIRDRFYGSASSTPITVFPHLMKLKNYHLAKLENRGRAVNFEKIIGEILDDISDLPGHLSLDDQGRFAVGYYHQRQDFFRKKQTNENLKEER